VPMFRRGEKVTIDCWIYKMEHYLRSVGKDESDDRSMWRQEMLVRFHSEHFDEVKGFVDLPYSEFLYKLRHAFAKADLTQTFLIELNAAEQKVDESVEVFMVRLRELVDRAFPKMSTTERETVVVAHFARGLRDSVASQMVSTLAKGSVGEALRLASASVANYQSRRMSGSSSSGAYRGSNRYVPRSRLGPSSGLDQVSEESVCEFYCQCGSECVEGYNEDVDALDDETGIPLVWLPLIPSTEPLPDLAGRAMRSCPARPANQI